MFTLESRHTAMQLYSTRRDLVYTLRKIIVERVFVQLKGASGLDHSLLRGLEKVDREPTLMATTQNIGKLHRAALAIT